MFTVMLCSVYYTCIMSGIAETMNALFVFLYKMLKCNSLNYLAVGLVKKRLTVCLINSTEQRMSEIPSEILKQQFIKL